MTNYSRSFAIFTYKCGDLSYPSHVTIGFGTPDGLFANHPFSSGSNTKSIACSKSSYSDWVNVVYEISGKGIPIIL